jgi:hypothetical protein
MLDDDDDRRRHRRHRQRIRRSASMGTVAPDEWAVSVLGRSDRAAHTAENELDTL